MKKRTYWQENLRLVGLCLLIWFTVSFGFGILLVDQLNGGATAADWMSAAAFISMAGLIAFLGYDGYVYLMGWTGGYVLLERLLAFDDHNSDGRIQYYDDGNPDFAATAESYGWRGNELTIDRDIIVLANPEIANLPDWVVALVAAGAIRCERPGQLAVRHLTRRDRHGRCPAQLRCRDRCERLHPRASSRGAGTGRENPRSETRPAWRARVDGRSSAVNSSAAPWSCRDTISTWFETRDTLAAPQPSVVTSRGWS